MAPRGHPTSVGWDAIVGPSAETRSPLRPPSYQAQWSAEPAVGRRGHFPAGTGQAGVLVRGGEIEEGERRLLLVVLFAVQFPIPEVAAGGEGLLTCRALQTLLVPGRLVDSHQEAVGDGPLAALADSGMRAVGACSAQDESRAVSAVWPSPGAPPFARGTPAAAPETRQPQTARPCP